MEFLRRAAGRPARLGVLPGTFNPVTVAHVALARAAVRRLDEVVFVLPRVFPHKEYAGASFGERAEMLRAAVAEEPECSFSIAASEGGLFLEIAGECRAVYGAETRITFLCGRDAAERIVGWEYGRPGAAAAMLGEFDLLVAGRGGKYDPPAAFRGAIHSLDLPAEMDTVSASEVRNRMALGERWEHLVPEAVRKRAREIYPGAATSR